MEWSGFQAVVSETISTIANIQASVRLASHLIEFCPGFRPFRFQNCRARGEEQHGKKEKDVCTLVWALEGRLTEENGLAQSTTNVFSSLCQTSIEAAACWSFSAFSLLK